MRIGDDLGKGTCCRERGTLVIIRGRGAAVGDNLAENKNHHGDNFAENEKAHSDNLDENENYHGDNIALLRTRTHTLSSHRGG